MEIRKAFKFELIPNGAQIRKMNQFCGCARFMFNKALSWQNTQYQADNDFKFSYAKIANLLPDWKKELPWLKDCHSQVLQQSLKDLEVAFRNFFAKRSDFPKFKKKRLKDNFRFPQGFKLDGGNSRIYLPKIGWLRYRKSRQVSGSLKNVTVSQKCGKWYISVQTEQEIQAPLPNGSEIGIDMGIVRFATLSNGQYFEPKNSFKTLSGSLKKVQQAIKPQNQIQ
jgi:putative transposase